MCPDHSFHRVSGGVVSHHTMTAPQWGSYNFPQLSHCLPEDSDQIPQGQVSVPQDCLCFRSHHKPVTSPAYYLMLLTNRPQVCMRRCIRWSPEQRSFRPCGVWGPASASSCSGSPSGISPDPPFGFLWQYLLHRHDWLTHWLLAVPAPLPSLEFEG